MNVERLMAQLVEDEGLRLKPYRCPAGKLTIGVGRNLEDRGVSRDEALFLLRNDVADFWAKLRAAEPWVENAPESVQEVLVNMAFNLGVAGLLGFKNTLGLIRAGKYAEAAAAMLASKWARQVGGRAKRLAEAIARA